MLSNFTLETSLGRVDLAIFYFSPWLKGYFVVLWTLVVISNVCSLMYICCKLNLSNVVNLIPLLDCVINLIGFLLIAVSSFNVWCKAITLTAKSLLLCGKFLWNVCLQEFTSSIVLNFQRSLHVLHPIDHKIHNCS